MKKVDLSELFQSLEKLGLDRNLVFEDQVLKKIQNDWAKMVGEFLGNQSLPKHLSDGKLTVVCKHSMLIQELEFIKPQILEKIRVIANPLLVEKIKFIAGSGYKS